MLSQETLWGATVGRDPNDNIYPITMAVVVAENKDSWSWFLETLVADLGPNGSNGKRYVTLLSFNIKLLLFLHNFSLFLNYYLLFIVFSLCCFVPGV